MSVCVVLFIVFVMSCLWMLWCYVSVSNVCRLLVLV